MEKDNIIDYEEIFEEKNKPSLQLDDFNEKNKSLYTILVYIVIFVLGFGSLFYLPFFQEKDSKYILLEQANYSTNSNNIFIVDKLYFEENSSIFNFKEENYVIINELVYIIKNDSLDKEWFIENIDEILLGKITSWDLENPSTTTIKVVISDNIEVVIANENLVILEKDYSIDQSGILIFLRYLVVLIPIILLSFKKIKFDYSQIILEEKKTFFSNLASITLTMYAVSILLGLISNILASIFGLNSVSSNQDAINLMLSSKYMLLTLFTITFMGPLVEELVFRASIFTLVKDTKKAVIISSLTFGLIHLTNELILLAGDFTFKSIAQVLIFSIPYVGMGVFLAKTYEKNNKNILLLYGVHAFYNLISGIISLF